MLAQNMYLGLDDIVSGLIQILSVGPNLVFVLNHTAPGFMHTLNVSPKHVFGSQTRGCWIDSDPQCRYEHAFGS